MIDRNTPVTEDEIHAYVDGELPADRREAVATWLASHPEDAAQVDAWRAQADAIRARYAPIATQPIPERLKLARLTRIGRRWSGIAAAAVAAAFLAGGIIGWFARDAAATPPAESDIFTADALSAHRLYIGEVRHPIEVGATESHLMPWLSRRIGTTLRAPDLASYGLKLLGGRLLPGPRGAAAFFMYESASGERYTLYCAKLTAQESALRYNAADKIAAFHWVEGDVGYAVSGPADRAKLLKIAQAAYEQMENRAPTPTRSSVDQLISRRGS